MKAKELQILCEQGLSLRQIASRAGVSMSTVRHYLRKYGLKTRRGPRGKTPEDLKTPRKCGHCDETEPTKFYGHKRSICGACQNRYNLERGRETRMKVLDHLGGRCHGCGFDRFASALDVHHLDPTSKDPGFATMRYWSWKRLVKELEGCVLLCKNYHAAVHAGEWVLAEMPSLHNPGKSSNIADVSGE